MTITELKFNFVSRFQDNTRLECLICVLCDDEKYVSGSVTTGIVIMEANKS